MKPLIALTAVLALAAARPEMYKEQEDFQYSRSSSDDGTKSGYYGAQRGNMGGNYERAHNMDSLAQNQMSGLVRQVDGELGDGAQQRTGSVYTAANSRGTYGSGHYDLSNLAGRNFQEGNSYGNSHSSSSLSQSSSSQSSHNRAAYSTSHSQSNSGLRYGGYQQHRDAQTQTDDLQALDNAQTSNFYGYGAGRQSSHSTGYQASRGIQEHNEYDRSNVNLQSGYGSNVHSRLISATPVRVVITPGTRVAIPIGVQTYTTAQRSSAYDQNALSEAETITGNGDSHSLASRPDAKHYESSYSYHKQWEKHDTIPTAISLTPTESTIPRNSELYEDTEAHRASNQYDARGASSHNTHSSAASGRYNVKSGTSQSRYQSNYNAQESGASRSNTDAYTQTGYNAHNQGVSSDALTYTGARYHGAAANLQSQTGYNAGSHTDLNSQVEDLRKPKSYQSSYSYHKSWERQGDPYVIKPASNQIYDAQTSQRLTSGTKNQRYATYHAGSNYNQGLADCDCDEYGNVRVARSIDEADDMVQQNVDTFEGQNQQAQNAFDFGQNEDFGQQNVGQQSQSKWDTLQDLEQHSQNVGQQYENKWDNLQDFGQQSQNEFEQQSQNKRENLEDLGQQSANWDQIGDIGQQSASNWEQIGDLGQQTVDQKTWDKVEDIAQQSSDQSLESLNQQTQNFLGQQDQDFISQVANSDQQSQRENQFEVNKPDLQSQNGQENIHRTFESPWDKFDLIDAKATEITTEMTTEQNKLTIDHTTDKNDFYWHQINGITREDQQVNSFDKESEYQSNHNMQSVSQLFSDSKRQNYSDVVLDNDNDKHDSYSGGFANPLVYDHPIPAYQRPFEVGDYGVQRWSAHDSDSHSSSSSQQHESNSQISSYFQNSNSPLFTFWGKLDNIEKETLSNIHDDNIRPIESSDNKYNTINATEKTSTTTVLPVLNKNVPEIPEDSRGDISSKQDEFEDMEEPERPEDIGRGDIGPESVSNTANMKNKNHNSIPQHNADDTLLDSDLTVLGLAEQKARENQDKISVTSTTTSTTPDNKRIQDSTERFNTQTHNIQNKQVNLTTTELQRVNLTQQYVNNFEQIRQQHDKIEQQNHYIQWQNVPNIEQENVNTVPQTANQNFDQQNINRDQLHLNNSKQQHVHDSPQNKLKIWDNIDLGLEHLTKPQEQQTSSQFDDKTVSQQQNQSGQFEQQNTQYEQQSQSGQFEQQNTQFEQSQSGQFEQQNTQFEQQSQSGQFEQQNTKFEQQSQSGQFEQQYNNFEQQNQFNQFEQQYSHFDQQNQLSQFEQQNTNFEQQNAFSQFEHQISNFDQQNQYGQFDQQNANFEQQNQFSHDLEGRPLGQNEDNLEQQSVHNFDQHSARDFGQQHEPLEQDNLQSFSQSQSMQDFELQKENIHEHNLNKFGQQSENIDDFRKVEVPQETQDSLRNALRHQQHPEINEELIKPKVYNDVQSNKPKSSDIEGIIPPVEPTTEKPGFWKSVGHKFSSAKNKVVSWFSSSNN